MLHTGAIAPKSTKDTIGVAVMTLKRGQKLLHVRDYREGEFAKPPPLPHEKFARRGRASERRG